MTRTKRGLGVAAVAAAAVALVAGAVVGVTGTAGSAGATPPVPQPPTVTHTGKAPTGYTVTFHYYDRTATRVQIKGEWYFSDPTALPKLAGSSDDDVVPSQGITPLGWRPGDVPLAYPNSTAANWPVADMKEQGQTGNWSYTTPLPSGVFNYGFFVNCTSPTQSGCTQLVDPGNAPWNNAGTGVQLPGGSLRSQVFVPSDPEFATMDLSFEGPAVRHGKLQDVAYPAPTSTTPAGHSYVSVYTPPGYDAIRAKAYPTLYALAPDDEVAWTTQGDLANLLDNLIADGEMQPVVLVTPNINGFPASSDSSVFDANVIDSLIPWVQSKYHVSTDPSQRAVVGMGNAANIVDSLLFNDTASFGYYGVWGMGTKGPFTVPATVTADQAAAMKKVGISIGGGYEDPHHWYLANEVGLLSAAGVPVTSDFVIGGHEWYAWRLNAKDFLTRTAFLPLSTGALTAG